MVKISEDRDGSLAWWLDMEDNDLEIVRSMQSVVSKLLFSSIYAVSSK